jgi:hypothetical protein
VQLALVGSFGVDDKARSEVLGQRHACVDGKGGRLFSVRCTSLREADLKHAQGVVHRHFDAASQGL